MSRPLIQRRIDELEAMFEVAKGDPASLRLLEAELSLRPMPRAVSLLAKVKRFLGSESVFLDGRSPLPASREPAGEMDSVPKIGRPLATQPMPVETALKLLRISATSSWEDVESSRRNIVDRARPDKSALLDEKRRGALQEDAQLANAAYLILLQKKQV